MRTYFTKRLLGLIPTLIGIIAVFSIFFTALPGDALSTKVPMDPKLKQQIRHELHLDEPKIIQLKYWLEDIAKGDLGISQYSGEPINPIIKHVIKESFPIYLATFIISILIAIPLGIISAYRHNSIKDRLISVFSMIGISLPEFMTAFLLLWILTYKFSIFPSPYLMFNDIMMAGEYTLKLKVKYSILPTIVLIICTIPGYIKYTRAGMLQILRDDYIRTAKSKGLREKVILYRHALKNAIIPLMTYIPTSIQTFITATVFVDITFQRSGIGTLLFSSIFTRDYPLTMATNLVITLIILLCNFTIDILYAFVDPRVKLK